MPPQVGLARVWVPTGVTWRLPHKEEKGGQRSAARAGSVGGRWRWRGAPWALAYRWPTSWSTSTMPERKLQRTAAAAKELRAWNEHLCGRRAVSAQGKQPAGWGGEEPRLERAGCGLRRGGWLWDEKREQQGQGAAKDIWEASQRSPPNRACTLSTQGWLPPARERGEIAAPLWSSISDLWSSLTFCSASVALRAIGQRRRSAGSARDVPPIFARDRGGRCRPGGQNESPSEIGLKEAHRRPGGGRPAGSSARLDWHLAARREGKGERVLWIYGCL